MIIGTLILSKVETGLNNYVLCHYKNDKEEVNYLLKDLFNTSVAFNNYQGAKAIHNIINIPISDLSNNTNSSIIKRLQSEEVLSLLKKEGSHNLTPDPGKVFAI